MKFKFNNIFSLACAAGFNNNNNNVKLHQDCNLLLKQIAPSPLSSWKSDKLGFRGLDSYRDLRGLDQGSTLIFWPLTSSQFRVARDGVRTTLCTLN